MLVLDKAKDYLKDVEYKYYFMLACLCHDFGKVNATTEVDGVIKAINHENMGDDLIKSFLNRFTNEKMAFKYCLNMARCHMKPNICARDNSSIKATNKMYDLSICPNDLIYLSHVDHLGQVNDLDNKSNLDFLFSRLDIYKELMSRPQVTGRDLLALKLKPRKYYRYALEYAHKLHLSGVKREDALPQVVSYFEKIKNQGIDK